MNYFAKKFEESGMTQTGISQEIGISQGHFHKILNQERPLTYNLAKKASKCLSFTNSLKCYIAAHNFIDKNNTTNKLKDKNLNKIGELLTNYFGKYNRKEKTKQEKIELISELIEAYLYLENKNNVEISCYKGYQETETEKEILKEMTDRRRER